MNKNILRGIDVPFFISSITNSFVKFNGCSGLTSVNIQDITAWYNIDFADWGANPLRYAHNLYLNGEKITELVIPNGTKTIKICFPWLQRLDSREHS